MFSTVGWKITEWLAWGQCSLYKCEGNLPAAKDINRDTNWILQNFQDQNLGVVRLVVTWGPVFKPHLGGLVPWLRVFVVFPKPSRKSRSCLKIGHVTFLPLPFLFINWSTLHNLGIWESDFKKAKEPSSHSTTRLNSRVSIIPHS